MKITIPIPLVFIVLLILKLGFGYNIPWLWVFAPFWLSAIFVAVALAFMGLFMVLLLLIAKD